MSDVGVIGATGLVGGEMLRVLAARKFPIDELRAFASPRSVGNAVPFGDQEIIVRELVPGSLTGLDFVMIDVDDPLAAQWAPVAVEQGARVIDNSAAFRMDAEVPLVISEVNPEDLQNMPKGIVSCPNCTTMVLAVALKPLHDLARIRRMVVSTYQSVSGAGQRGIQELDEQWRKSVDRLGEFSRAGAIPGTIEPGEVWPKPIAGNVIPLAGSITDDGYTSEESKLMHESRKILHAPDLQVSATCVRVPVFVGHSISANIEFEHAIDANSARKALESADGVIVGEDQAPTPLESAGIDPVIVGRIRNDPTRENTLNIWVTGDNLRKGAALNAVQIAELLL